MPAETFRGGMTSSQVIILNRISEEQIEKPGDVGFHS